MTLVLVGAAIAWASSQVMKVLLSLWTGPGGTLSVLHFDRVHNFSVQLYGRKKWILIPPEQYADVYWPCDELRAGMLLFSPVDAERPDLADFPRFARARPIEVTLEPGEILFLPTGWWHQVRSLDPSISLNFFWFAPLRTPLALRRYCVEWLRLFVKQKLQPRVPAPARSTRL